MSIDYLLANRDVAMHVCAVRQNILFIIAFVVLCFQYLLLLLLFLVF